MRVALFFAISLAACSGRDPAAPADDARAEENFRRYRRPDLILDGLGLRGGERILDVGAGRGFLTLPLARAVGASGKVTAIDVDGRALAELQRRAAIAKIPVETRVVEPHDPMLEDREQFDLILMSEVDHLLPDRKDYLLRLRRHLVGGGRIAVCNKRYDRDALVAAASAAGLVQVAETTTLPAHFLLIFGVGR